MGWMEQEREEERWVGNLNRKGKNEEGRKRNGRRGGTPRGRTAE